MVSGNTEDKVARFIRRVNINPELSNHGCDCSVNLLKLLDFDSPAFVVTGIVNSLDVHESEVI